MLKQISLLLICYFGTFGIISAQDSLTIGSPEYLAQQQLDAYNSRDLEAFLEPFSEDVEIYIFPDQLTSKGKDDMRSRYSSWIGNAPNLHCELVNRIVMGNTVIDQEKVTGIPGLELLEAIAIYKIENGKIAKVYFLRK